ncbi:MAG: hypothetical protein ACRENB_17285 [Gemmatimonadales bacterium]
MVNPGRGRRGVSTIGCLFTALIVAVVLYYTLDIGRAYWDYYKLLDQMKTTARFAQTQSDEQILRTLRGTVDELGLPFEAKRFVIRRFRTPPMVRIRTEYQVIVELPFTHRAIRFQPSVEQRQ